MTIDTSARREPPRRREPTGSAVAPGSDVSARSACKLRGLCTPCCGLTRSEIDVAGRLVFNRLHLRRGESLYRSGERFTSLYVVRSGFFKSTAQHENARDQVLRFSMTDEVLGSYLGEQFETVSRTFSKFQQTGLISVEHKRVRILDRAGLERVVNLELN